MIAVVVHVVVSVLDSSADVGVAEALVPGVATVNRLALTWGVLGLYLIAGAVLTTWPRRLANRSLWRWVHLASTLGMVVAMVHGYEMGTDARRAGLPGRPRGPRWADDLRRGRADRRRRPCAERGPSAEISHLAHR